MNYKISFLFLFTLSAFCCFSQTTTDIDSNYIKIKNELNEFKKTRTKDSLRIDILTREIKSFLTESQSTPGKKTVVDSTEIKRKIAEVDRIRAITEGAPIILMNDTIFKIYARLGQYSAFERANSVQKKIEVLYEAPFFYKDSLKIENNFNTEIITYNGKIIIGVSEFDALWESTTMLELANTFKEKIGNKIEEHREKNSFKVKLIRAGEFMLIVFVVIGMILLLNKLIKKIKNKFINHNKTLEQGLNINKHQIFKHEQLKTFLSKCIDILKFILFLLILFSTIPIALKIFPSTSVWANEMQKLLLDPLKSLIDSVIAYLPKLVKIIIILFFGRYIIKIFKYFTKEIAIGAITINGFYKEWAKPTFLIIRFLFIVFLLIIIFPDLPGSNTIAFQGISVFLGILISIGSSSAISNAVAGIVITYMRPFHLKDWIKAGDIVGLVIEKNALVTRLKTINNEDITIPNSTILTGATVNYSSIGRESGLSITTKINVSYDYPEKQITELLISAASKTIGVSNRVKPYVFELKLNDNNATYEINAITFEPDKMFHIQSDLIKNIHNIFIENNISLKAVQIVSLRENIKPANN